MCQSSPTHPFKMAKQSHRLVPGGGPVVHPVLPQSTGMAHPTPSTVTGKMPRSSSSCIIANISYVGIILANKPKSLNKL